MNQYGESNQFLPTSQEIDRAKAVVKSLAAVLIPGDGQTSEFLQRLPEAARPTGIEINKGSTGERAEVKFTFATSEGAASFQKGLKEICTVSNGACETRSKCEALGAQNAMTGLLQYGHSIVSSDIALLERFSEALNGHGEHQAEIVAGLLNGVESGQQQTAGVRR